jgi:hypothetical protein
MNWNTKEKPSDRYIYYIRNGLGGGGWGGDVVMGCRDLIGQPLPGLDGKRCGSQTAARLGWKKKEKEK